MSKVRVPAVALAMLAIASFAFAQAKKAPAAPKAAHQMEVVAAESLKWSEILPGATMAVVSGDPGKAGDLFVIRIKTVDGLKIPPHWHPQDEYITVLKGTFLIGMGEKWDAAGLKPQAAGTFIMMPKEMRHYAGSKGEAIVQVHGVGPFVINYVNPADDPANRAKAKAPAKK